MAGPIINARPVSPFSGVSGQGDAVEVQGLSDGDGESGEEDESIPVGESCGRFAVDKEEKVVKRLADPKLPSADEVEQHYISGHLPYRSWCPVCVKADRKSTR